VKLTFLGAFALALAVPAGVAAPSPRPGAVIADGVREAVAQRGSARVIVAFRPGVAEDAEPIRRRILTRVRSRGFAPTAAWRTVAAMAGRVTADGLARLRADPEVAAIDLDRGGSGGDAESLALIRASAAHQAGVVGSGVTVAVIDGGIDRTHPDLADSLVAEHCIVPPAGCPNGAGEQDGPGSARDDHGHGTNVTGIVTANGTVAPVGVAPGAGIVAVKVLDANNRFAGSSQIISALDWVARTRPDVRVVNLSLGTDALFAGPCDNANATTMAYASAVRELRVRNVTVVASSMNDASPFSMAAPACIDRVISVGAVYDSAFGPFALQACADAATAADRVACFSNGGTGLDLLAPGARIFSTGAGGGVSEFAGTSQAAPHVAGAVALVLQTSPNLSPDGLESVLEASGSPVLDARNGAVTPRIDVAAALQRANAPPPPPPPPPVPEIRVAPSRLGFGRVRIGRATSRVLRISNVGTAPLTLRTRVRAPFGVETFIPRTIGAGSSLRISVVFRPRRLGVARSTFTLSTNDPARPATVVRLTGTGVRR
jgi:subtilisin family serine protease